MQPRWSSLVFPANKTSSPAGTTVGFNVATFKDSTGGLTYSYGQTLTDNLGNLAYNPSAAHPDFEFTVKNFSKIPGLNALTNGFYLSAYAGSQKTVIVGKSDIANTFVKPQGLSEGNIDNPPVVTPANPADSPGSRSSRADHPPRLGSDRGVDRPGVSAAAGTSRRLDLIW